MAHTARSYTYQAFEGGGGAPANGHAGAERPRSLAGGGESWLETLHRQHVSAREKRHVDVTQANLLRKELVTFFGLYRRDDLGRADDLLREWKGGRELEDINRELKKRYQHNLFDLHELDSANPIRNNPLEPVILAERLARAQKDADKQREERGAAEKRCEELQQQNDLLRADLALAVEEGIKYRETLREWAEIEEKRLAQAPAPAAPGEDVGVLKREVEMLREARQREMATAKENFERELRRSEADVRVLKEEYQKLLKTKNEQDVALKQQQHQHQQELSDLRANNEDLRTTISKLESTAQQGVDHASELASHAESSRQELAAARRENVALQETVRKLKAEMQAQRDKDQAYASAATQKLEEENSTLRQENDILLKAHHESKHSNDTLRAANQEGREAVSALQRKIIDLEETVRQKELNEMKSVSADEANLLKMQVDMLRKENEDLRRQQELEAELRNRSSLDSVSGLDETDSEMPSLDATLNRAAAAGVGGPQTVMSSRSLAAIAKSPQQLADALVSMNSAERFAAIKQGGITAADLAAAMACCPLEKMLAIFRDLPDEIKTEVLAALPDNARQQLMGLLSPKEVAALVCKCSDEERRLIVASMDHDLLAVVLNLLSPVDRKMVMSQLPLSLREAAQLAEKIRKMDAPDRAQALLALPEGEAALVVAFLAPADLAPALDTMHRKQMAKILGKASATKQAATAVQMEPVPRGSVFQHLLPAAKSNVLTTASPVESALLLLGLGKSERQPVVSALPAQVQDAIQTAESLLKVPAEERWDAVLKLDVEDQGLATNWLLPKEIVRMLRSMPPTETTRLFKSLQPDVCAAVLQQMTVEERGQALGALPQMSSAKVVDLLPRASLVNALAILPPSRDAAVMTTVSKDKMETARKAVELTRASVVDRADLISKMSPDQVGEVLAWTDPKCSCEALSEMALGGRKTTLASMTPETRSAVFALMSPIDRAKALNSMSPSHRSHALRTLSANSISAAMTTMSSAERNLVTASLPAAARRALLKSKEFDKIDTAQVLRAAGEMSGEDRDRTLAWLQPESAAALLSQSPEDQQVETLEGMAEEDVANVLRGLQPHQSAPLLALMAMRQRIKIMGEMTVATAGKSLNAMSPNDKKASLSALPLDMEDALTSWQKGELSGDAKLCDTSQSIKTGNKKDAAGDVPDAVDASSERRRSRGKKDVKNLLDSGLLAHAFPNVSRVMRTHKDRVSTEGADSDDSD